ncbi:hypothetical protein WJX72_008787 [[Myrmecia] bisecta]|uniref:Uncharacterized protein n=1 Tax=[Myrmecia] bisecta TaxID=41462 RepID=A0AAW1Q9P5_9CHLO
MLAQAMLTLPDELCQLVAEHLDADNPLLSLDRLRHLFLEGFMMTDLDPFADCTSLQSLGLERISLENGSLAPLALLTNLHNLSLANTLLGSVEPLTTLSKLKDLDLSGTALPDASPLSALTNLQALRINKVHAVGFNVGLLTQLQNLGMAGAWKAWF